jgi:nucleotide-binding universal stress UspA family protein
MYRHILIPTDGSQLSQNAVAHGAALAKSINAKVTVLTVSTPFHTFASCSGPGLRLLNEAPAVHGPHRGPAGSVVGKSKIEGDYCAANAFSHNQDL